MGQGYPHPRQICMFKIQGSTPTSTVFAQLSEFKFWAVNPSVNLNTWSGKLEDHFNRYYAVSFRYYNLTLPTTLIDYFKPKLEGNALTWKSNTGNFNAYFFQTSKVSWYNSTYDYIPLCTPGINTNL